MQALQAAPSANLTDAYNAWQSLQSRESHPDGSFDSAGRWYPSASERCSCCDSIRTPSRSFPYSLMKHCRSVEHVAESFGVTASELRKEINRHKPRKQVVHADHYKLVAVVDGRMVSVYDGETEYKLGVTLKQACKPDHGGGYYCYPTREVSRRAFPSLSVHETGETPFALIRVKVGGRKIKYDNGKVAFGEMTPVEIIWTEAPVNA